MNKEPVNLNAERKSEAAMFDHEKLDVYHFELKFIAWATALVEELPRSASGKTAAVRDRLDRASLSALLNTAEGNGKRQRQVRAKCFDDARGSATECAACLDVLVAKQAATIERVAEGRRLLLKIVSILCGLIDRFDGSAALPEESLEEQTDELGAEPRASYCSRRSRMSRRTRTSRI